MRLGILQDIDTSQGGLTRLIIRRFTEVLAYDGYQVVKAFLVFQVCHLCGKLIKAKR